MHAMIRIFGMMHFLTSYAHGGFISVVLEEGVIGLVLIVALIATGVRNALSCLVHTKDRPHTNWYIGILFLTVIYNIDEVTIGMPRYLPWMMCILALIGLAAESAPSKHTHGIAALSNS
jgi:O-antigen ligase